MAVKSNTTTLTAARLRELLHYDPETGIFTWATSRRGVSAGKKAGCISRRRENQVYEGIGVDRVFYPAHRLAWLYMTGEWPSGQIDHADRNGLNNKWNNLRDATHSQNQANRTKSRNNSSGYKGVYFNKNDKMFRAQASLGGRRVYLGNFETAEEAHRAYAAAVTSFHGEFARTE